CSPRGGGGSGSAGWSTDCGWAVAPSPGTPQATSRRKVPPRSPPRGHDGLHHRVARRHARPAGDGGDLTRSGERVDLFEYQGKQFFASFGIPVSAGAAVDTVDDAVAAADKLGYPVVVKAQVQVGGRGKAGGVKLASNTAEALEHATNILGLDIKGHVVKRLWIEKASDIAEEY